LQALTDLGQFSRREVDALLLGIRTRLLAVGAMAERVELFRHLLDSMGQIGQLTCDERCILFAPHLEPYRILWPARLISTRQSSGGAHLCGVLHLELQSAAL
jgi:hypothetical protein